MKKQKKRKNFHGSIDSYPTDDGVRWRVRARIDGKLKTLESGLLSHAAAEEFARGYVALRTKREVAGSLTLRQFGEGFLDRREQRGIRGIRRERNRWKNHIAGKSVGVIPLKALMRSDIVAWRDELMAAGLSRETQKLCMVLVRRALTEALDRDLVASNVAADVEILRGRQDVSKDDLEGVLLPDDQRHLLEAAAKESDRAHATISLAMLTGLRLSEFRELKWEDVHISGTRGYIDVRYSEGGLATKSGRVGRVELLGPAIALLDKLPRTSPWVITGQRGGQVAAGKALCGARTWEKLRRETGIDITWHGLRHTCATSLLAGWWGKRWSIEAVCRQLRHSSIKVTERYARLVEELARADAVGMFQQSSSDELVGFVDPGEFTGANYWIRTSDLRVTNALVLSAKTGPSVGKSVSHDTHRRSITISLRAFTLVAVAAELGVTRRAT